MILLLTEPKLYDTYQFYYNILNDYAIVNEFVNYRGFTLDRAKAHISEYIKLNAENSVNWLTFIKLTDKVSPNDIYDETNSQLIGFINSSKSRGYEKDVTGINDLLNFGIIENYRKRGLMTIALKMKLERLYELGFNFVAAFVKGNNFGSEKVLEKCGFDKIQDSPFHSLYTKRIKMDEERYKESIIKYYSS
jgi:RimJ/RimL family protein N-acetyltransferase